MKGHYRPPVLHSRLVELMDKAGELRNSAASQEGPIDLASFLEGRNRHLLPKFDWIVAGQEKFEEFVHDAEAYMDFSKGKLLVIRDRVYDALIEGKGTAFHKAAFVVSHEIGHLICHSGSRKQLPRRVLGSKTQYAHNPKLENEASIFAGSLMVPTTSIAKDMDGATIALRYNTSQMVADTCVNEIREYQRFQKLREKLR